MGSKQVEKTVLRRMVVQYHQDGLSVRKIAEKTKTSKSNVQYIIQTFKKEGRIDATKPPGRPGPSSRTLRLLKFQVEKQPFATRRENAEDFGTSVSTVRRYLPMLDYTPRIARRKPLLSKKNKNKRRLWANEMAAKPMDFWKRVIFSDESRFAQFSLTLWIC